MELHTDVFVKHADKDIHESLSLVFQTANSVNGASAESAEAFLKRSSLSLSPIDGELLAEALFKTIVESGGELSVDLKAESREEVAGYHVYHFVHGSCGDRIVEALLTFISKVAPGVDARACLEGDDDPWEIFYRNEGTRITQKHYEPAHEERANKKLPPEYVWWHEGMPSEVSQGIINTWKAIGDEEWLEDHHEEPDESLSVLPKYRIVTGKVWKTNRTESGLIIKWHAGWPSCFDIYDAILDDMSNIKHGDYVEAEVQSIDEENRLLNCTLVLHKLKKDITVK